MSRNKYIVDSDDSFSDDDALDLLDSSEEEPLDLEESASEGEEEVVQKAPSRRKSKTNVAKKEEVPVGRKKRESQKVKDRKKAEKEKKKEDKARKTMFNKMVEGDQTKPHVPPSASIIKSVRPPIKNPRLIKGYKETAYERDMRVQALGKLKSQNMYDDDISLTEDQKRLLYLISLYSYAAKTEEERERCIRKSALMVLLFEGIVMHVFDYDYAPASVVVGNPPRRVFLNVSQEAKDDIDDLMECALIKAVRLSSKFGCTDVAYQLAPRGVDVLADFSKSTITAVNALAHDPNARDYLLEVEWDEMEGLFSLTSGAGYTRRSGVTDAEDVSYVSSAYIPQCLRIDKYAPEPHSYADQAEDAANGCASIKDELSELMHLENVHMLMAEWIPFGANEMAGLNARLGSDDKVQGGNFTAQLDDGKCATQCAVDAGLTSVRVLDHLNNRHVNCEASIDYPESAGITQIENFGLSINSSGRVICGLQIESIMDRVKDEMAIDLLARLMVDIQMDSSSLLDSLLSPYQRSVLDVVYRGHVMQRPKFSILLADSINPKMLAEKYMDGEDHENELRQILGATSDAYDLEDDFLLILGETGILLVGASVREHEEILIAFLFLQSMNMFIGGLFERLFELNDGLTNVHRILDVYERDPNKSSSLQVQEIRNGLSGASHVAIRLHEALECMANGLKKIKMPDMESNTSKAALKLFDLLNVQMLFEDVKDRVEDLDRNVDGAQRNLRALREMSAVVRDSLLVRLNDQIMITTKRVDRLYKSAERTSTSMNIIQYICAGMLAFATLDRLNLDGASWAAGLNDQVWWGPVVLAASLIGWMLASRWVIKTYKWQQTANLGGINVRMGCNIPISIKSLKFWLKDKDIIEEVEEFDRRGDIMTLKWQERHTAVGMKKWLGSPPSISLRFDQKAGILLNITMHSPEAFRNWRRGGDMMTSELLRQTLMADLDTMSVILHDRLGKK
jgi:hypothetical protein